jgi:hypothetical protein
MAYEFDTLRSRGTQSEVELYSGPKNVWTESDKTRSALGEAIHWYPAYNDGVKGEVARSMGIGFGEVNNSDNRARGGNAVWGDPVIQENIRFAEKYAPPLAAGSNPTAWIEYNKGGVTSNERDALLRQKEQGEVQASALTAPSAQANLFQQPAANVGSKSRAYERLKRETVAVEREALPDGGAGRAPDWRPGAASEKADANWGIALNTVTGMRRWQEKARMTAELEARREEEETALSALYEFANSGGGSGSVLHTLTGLPRMVEKRPQNWLPAPDPQYRDPAREALTQACASALASTPSLDPLPRPRASTPSLDPEPRPRASTPSRAPSRAPSCTSRLFFHPR